MNINFYSTYDRERVALYMKPIDYHFRLTIDFCNPYTALHYICVHHFLKLSFLWVGLEDP